jgi:hypothetical protein
LGKRIEVITTSEESGEDGWESRELNPKDRWFGIEI